MPNTNSLSNLLSALNAARQLDDSLILTPALVPDGDIHVFLKRLPGQQLILEDVAITADAAPTPSRLDLIGRVVNPWTAPHLSIIPLSDIEVRASFVGDPASGGIISSLAIVGATIVAARNDVLLESGSHQDGTPSRASVPASPLTTNTALHDVVASRTAAPASPGGLSPSARVTPATALLARLNTALQADRGLLLTPDLVPAGDVESFLNTLPDRQLLLDGATIVSGGVASTTEVVLTGRSAATWPMPDLSAIVLSGIAIRAGFSFDPAGDTIVSSLAISATIGAGPNQILLTGAARGDGTLDLHTVGPVTAMMALDDMVRALKPPSLPDLRMGLPPLFKSIPISTLALTFGFDENATTSVTLTSQLTTTWSILDSGLLALARPLITLNGSSAPAAGGQRTKTFAATLDATTMFGQVPFKVTLDLTGGDPLCFRAVPVGGAVPPTLLDIAAVIGGPDLQQVVQANGQRLGFADLSIDALTATVSLQARTLSDATITGYLALGGSRLDLTLSLFPTFSFTGSLPSAGFGPARIRLDAVALSFLGEGTGLPQLPLLVDTFTLSGTRDSDTVAVTSTAGWDWDLSGAGAGPVLTLQGLDFNAQRSASGVTAGIATDWLIAGLPFNLSGAYQGAGAGWLLTGTNTLPIGGAGLGDLVEKVAGTLKVAVPAALTQAIAGLRISTLSLSLDTQTRTFTFLCDTQATTVEIGGVSYPIDFQANFSVADGPGTGQRQINGHLAADLRIGSTPFKVTLDLTDGGPLSFRAVPATDGVPPTLRDIVQLIDGGLPQIAQLDEHNCGLADVSIDALTAGYSFSSHRLTDLTVTGYLAVGGSRLDLSVSVFPDFSYTGSLPSAGFGPARISFDNIAGSLGLDVSFPSLGELLIDTLSLSGTRDSDEVALTSTQAWGWRPDGHPVGLMLALQGLNFNTQRSPQGVTANIDTICRIGQFPFKLSLNCGCSGGPSLVGTARLPIGGASLSDLLQEMGGELDVVVPTAMMQAVQGVRISTLALSLDQDPTTFTFVCDTAPIPVHIGLHRCNVVFQAKVSVNHDAVTGQRQVDLHLEADLPIGPATFVLSYDTGPSGGITGTWSDPYVTLDAAHILTAIGINDPLSVPDDLDLSLTSVSFQCAIGEPSFTLSAETSCFGDAFLTLEKGPNGWGVVFGVDSAKTGSLSGLPGMPANLHGANLLPVSRSAFVIATQAFSHFSVPSLPRLPSLRGPRTPGAGTGRSVTPLISGHALQLPKGFSLFPEIDLGTAPDLRMLNLGKIIGCSSLLLQVSLSPSAVYLSIELAGGVSIPSAKGRLPLTDPTVCIDLAPEFAVTLSGGLQFSVHGTPVTATASLTISETEAEVKVSLAADQGPLPALPGLPGLHFEKFAVELGVIFEPPAVDLGVQASFRVGPVRSLTADQFAFVLEVVEEVPNLRYLSFYIDSLDFGQVVTLFTDVDESSRLAALEVVKGSDLSFHWSESALTLPDGSVAAPGFGFSGSIQIFEFGAHATMEVPTSGHISGFAEMSPVHLNDVLHVTGDGRGIRRTDEQLSGVWTQVRNNTVVQRQPPPPTRINQVVAPGGPVIQFNRPQGPIIDVSCRVDLFDRVGADVDVTISDSGFAFALTYELNGIERFDLQCGLKDKDHFFAEGDLSIHVDTLIGPIRLAGCNLGTVHLNVDIGAGIRVSISPSSFDLSLSGRFDFEGLRFTVPTVNLDVPIPSLRRLLPLMLSAIRSDADALFSDLFYDVKKWADLIARDVVLGVHDMAETLQNAYHVTAEDAAHLMHQAKKDAETVAAGLRNVYLQTAGAAATSMKAAGFVAREVAVGVQRGFGLAAKDTARALKDAGFELNDVADALQSTFNETAGEAARAMRGIGCTADEVGRALNSVFLQTGQDTALAMHYAGFAAVETANTLRDVYSQTAADAGRLLGAAAYSFDDVGRALSDSFGCDADHLAPILKSIGCQVSDIGNTLRSVCDADANTAAQALEGAGFAAAQVGGFIQNTFDLKPSQLRGVLEGAGFAADKTQQYLVSLGGDFAGIFNKTARVFAPVVHDLDPRNW